MGTTTFFLQTEAEKKHITPDIIYHYTSANGLIGIVTNDEIWFSRYDCLNDIAEGKYILIPYQKALFELQKEINSSFFEEITDYKPNFYHFFEEKTLNKEGDSSSHYLVQKAAIPYLCCFSEDSDSLPMWNYYSKSGKYEGYNVGYNWKSLKESYPDLEKQYVIYDEQDQIEILKNDIREAYENFTKNNHRIKFVEYRLSIVLLKRALQFKHPAYRHEKEIRLIYWRPDDDRELAVKALELEFRQTHGLVVPFVRIRNTNKAIQSVTIGPLIKQDVADKTVKCLLSNYGISVPIKQSIVPIRY